MAGGLSECHIFVVSDGFRVAEEGQRPKVKGGRIDEEMVAPYEDFRDRLDDLAHGLARLDHLRAPEHKGFAGCLHMALRKVGCELRERY